MYSKKHIKKPVSVIFFFLVLPTFLLAADNADIIWTWGNGKFIASMFSWIYFILNIDTIKPIIKYAALIGVIVVTVREFAAARGGEVDGRGIAWKLIIFVLMTQAVVSLFLTVKQDSTHRVYIISANELSMPAWETCRPVNGDSNCYAPIGVKFLLNLASNFERSTVAMMEEAMYDANALSFSFARMGLGFPFTFHEDLSRYKATDSYRYQTFMEYFDNCLIYDIVDGDQNLNAIYKSDRLNETILSNNNRFTTVYSKSKPQGEVKACWQVEEKDLLGDGLTCANYAAHRVKHMRAGTPASEAATGDICEAIADYSLFAYSHTKDADAIIKQRITMNLMNEAMIVSALSSGLSPSDIAYGSAMADREQRSKWLAMGVMAKDWIPKLRGVMQAISIGIIWILAILSIASGSLRYLNYAVGFQVALVVWSILLVIINYQSIVTMGEMLPHIFIGELGSSQGQLTLLTQPAMDEENTKVMAYLGYLSIASFMIAMGIAGVSARALGAMGMGIGQLVAGSRIADGMTTGQQNFGTTKTGSDGASTFDHMRGKHEVITTPGQRTSTDFSSVSEDFSTDGLGNKISKTSVDGKSATGIETLGGSEATVTGDGNVTGAKAGSNISGQIGHSLMNNTRFAAGQAMRAMEQASTSLSDAQSSHQQVTRNATEAYAKSKGVSFDEAQREIQTEAASSALEDMYKEGTINREQFDEALKASIGGGFNSKFFKAWAEKSGTHTMADVETMEQAFNEKYSEQLTNQTMNAIGKSDSISAEHREGLTASLNESWGNVKSHQEAYNKAIEVATAAQKNREFIEANKGAVVQDIYGAYLQNVRDTQGEGRMIAEMSRMENRQWATHELSDFAKNYVNSDLKDKIANSIEENENFVNSQKGNFKDIEKMDHLSNTQEVKHEAWEARDKVETAYNVGKEKFENENIAPKPLEENSGVIGAKVEDLKNEMDKSTLRGAGRKIFTEANKGKETTFADQGNKGVEFLRKNSRKER